MLILPITAGWTVGSSPVPIETEDVEIWDAAAERSSKKPAPSSTMRPPRLVGIDVHPIPPGKGEPYHLHHDLLFAFGPSRRSSGCRASRARSPGRRNASLQATTFPAMSAAPTAAPSPHKSEKPSGPPEGFPMSGFAGALPFAAPDKQRHHACTGEEHASGLGHARNRHVEVVDRPGLVRRIPANPRRMRRIQWSPWARYEGCR